MGVWYENQMSNLPRVTLVKLVVAGSSKILIETGMGLMGRLSGRSTVIDAGSNSLLSIPRLDSHQVNRGSTPLNTVGISQFMVIEAPVLSSEMP